MEKAASRESALWSLKGFIKEMDTFSVLQMHFGEIVMCLGQIHTQWGFVVQKKEKGQKGIMAPQFGVNRKARGMNGN